MEVSVLDAVEDVSARAARPGTTVLDSGVGSLGGILGSSATVDVVFPSFCMPSTRQAKAMRLAAAQRRRQREALIIR